MPSRDHYALSGAYARIAALEAASGGGSGGTVILDQTLTARQAKFDTGVISTVAYKYIEVFFDGRTEKNNFQDNPAAYENVFDPVLVRFNADATVDNYRWRSVFSYNAESTDGAPGSGGQPEGVYDPANPTHSYRTGIMAGYANGNGTNSEAGRTSGFVGRIYRPGDAIAHKMETHAAFLDAWDSTLNREEVFTISGFHKTAAAITRIELINSWAVFGWVDRWFMAGSRCTIIGH